MIFFSFSSFDALNNARIFLFHYHPMVARCTELKSLFGRLNISNLEQRFSNLQTLQAASRSELVLFSSRLSSTFRGNSLNVFHGPYSTVALELIGHESIQFLTCVE